MKYGFRLICIAAMTAASAVAFADVTLYARDGFEGRGFTTENAVPNLDDLGFNDRANSVVVRDGTWLACTDAHFRGHCVTLRGGEYPSLSELGLGNSISSLRQIGGPRQVQGAIGDRPEQWGRHGRVVLYEDTNLEGRNFVIRGDHLRSLEGTGFNDRARSLRVENGYWMFCSDAHLQGTCRTFGPGEYVALPRGLDNRISSGRKISDSYPYRDRPNWDERG